MIRGALRKLTRFLSSGRVGTLLLVFVSAWSILASFVPQETTSRPEAVAGWGAAHPLVEPVVRVLGLHHAFAAPLFTVVVVLLAISLALCAWQRTKVAVTKSRIVRAAAKVDGLALAESHDFEVACDSALSESDILSVASDTLERIGIRTRRSGSVITTVSPPWTVWGSPVFHWALLALIVAMALGNMQRASGQMGLAVGESKIDEPASYGILSAGPLHSLLAAQRSIRLDAFELNYSSGGVDRGPTPTVSVLDARGEVIKSQRVYPNHTLKTGALAIYPADYGLSATVSLVDVSGAEIGRSSRLIDFSEEVTQGIRPVGYLVVRDSAGNASLKVFLTVPLDRVGTSYRRRLPAEPKARVRVTSMDDKPVLDRVLRLGEEMTLPVAGALRLVDVGYYARLQLVDDASIPLLYAALIIAMLGLSIATLARQQIVAAAVVDMPDGTMLAVRIRLWRNATTSRSEIENELTKALGGVQKGSTT